MSSYASSKAWTILSKVSDILSLFERQNNDPESLTEPEVHPDLIEIMNKELNRIDSQMTQYDWLQIMNVWINTVRQDYEIFANSM